MTEEYYPLSEQTIFCKQCQAVAYRFQTRVDDDDTLLEYLEKNPAYCEDCSGEGDQDAWWAGLQALIVGPRETLLRNGIEGAIEDLNSWANDLNFPEGQVCVGDEDSDYEYDLNEAHNFGFWECAEYSIKQLELIQREIRGIIKAVDKSTKELYSHPEEQPQTQEEYRSVLDYKQGFGDCAKH